MILIDIELCGNAARLYYGPNSVKSSYHGDDWNDRPLNNCGMVYDEYVSGVIDIGFDLDHKILDPEQDWRYNGDVPYCKNAFKARTAPCCTAAATSATCSPTGTSPFSTARTPR